MTVVAELLAGSPLPRAEARLLLALVLEAPIESLLAHPERPVDEQAVARFERLASRRAHGEPIAYLVGEKEFYGRRFAVSPAVLIPRPETELLVEVALKRLAGVESPRVLDLGTGSGCIAISLALECASAHVVAVDRSAAALAIARANAQRLVAPSPPPLSRKGRGESADDSPLPLRESADDSPLPLRERGRGRGGDLPLTTRIEFLESDWFQRVTGRFDVIVANPPYVSAADPHLAALRHEPQHALAAGADGLAELRRIIAAAPAHLVPGGWLAVEHGYDQAAAVRDLFVAAGFNEIEAHRDAAGIERVCSGVLQATPV